MRELFNAAKRRLRWPKTILRSFWAKVGLKGNDAIQESAESISFYSNAAPESPLQDVQILTRFCAAEIPYWHAFVEHYKNLGVRNLHVCVENGQDYQWLQRATDCNGLERLTVQTLDSGINPSDALEQFNLDAIREFSPYTLMVDCDEYFVDLGSGYSLAKLFSIFANSAQLQIPWLMRPILQPGDELRGGFWGHVGKPAVRSEQMLAVETDHGFLVSGNGLATSRAPAVPVFFFGCVLVHFWGRSFRDCLIKVFFNRFVDEKSADQREALSMIRSGALPALLRLLAFLDLQPGYLAMAGVKPVVIDLEAEERFLRQFITKQEEAMAWHSYQRYRSLLLVCMDRLPCYPAISLLELVDRLPMLKDNQLVW